MSAQVTELQAGPEMDAEIARLVFEFRVEHVQDSLDYYRYWHVDGHGYFENWLAVKSYSTDIAAAWLVVEKMRERRFQFKLSTGIDFEPEYVGGPHVTAYFRNPGSYPDWKPIVGSSQSATPKETGEDDTEAVCLTICRAAIQALAATPRPQA